MAANDGSIRTQLQSNVVHMGAHTFVWYWMVDKLRHLSYWIGLSVWLCAVSVKMMPDTEVLDFNTE